MRSTTSSRYFRREWDETRSTDHPGWGAGTYYFETDAALNATRQLEVYDCGRRLRYDAAHPEDADGFLEFGSVFPADEWPELFEITAREFETEWSRDEAGELPAPRRRYHP